MQNTLAKDVMKKQPVIITPETTVAEAASKMKETECGVLPVGTADKLEGMITDRDIVVRTIAAKKDPATEKVRDHMTKSVHFCKESDTLKQVAQQMSQHDVSRLMVLDAAGKVSGILSFGCILRKELDNEAIAEVVAHATGRKAAA